MKVLTKSYAESQENITAPRPLAGGKLKGHREIEEGGQKFENLWKLKTFY